MIITPVTQNAIKGILKRRGITEDDIRDYVKQDVPNATIIGGINELTEFFLTQGWDMEAITLRLYGTPENNFCRDRLSAALEWEYEE